MASALNSFDSAALRGLRKKIDEYIEVNAKNLAFGSSIVQSDVHATAMHYCEAVAYIRALNDVIGMCADVEDDLLRKS